MRESQKPVAAGPLVACRKLHSISYGAETEVTVRCPWCRRQCVIALCIQFAGQLLAKARQESLA